MKALKHFYGGILITSLFLIGCMSNDKFLGDYSQEENGEPVFTIINSSNNTYTAKLLHIKSLKDYVFKYNSKTKTLVSLSNDTISLTGKENELRFTNENGPAIFYKVK